MSVALLTRGYICPTGFPRGLTIGRGPTITSVKEPTPEIARAQTEPRLSPEIDNVITDSQEFVPSIDEVQTIGDPVPEIDSISTDSTVLVPVIKTVKTEDDD